MKTEKSICVLCGGEEEIDNMSILAETVGICGRDLGFVCKPCIEHIDNLQYFQRIFEKGETENA